MSYLHCHVNSVISEQFKHMEINLTIDTLVMVLKSMKLTSLHQILVEGVHRNYILNKNNLIQQLEGGKIYDICLPETYHFLPSPLGHFISIVYSSNQNPDTLSKNNFKFIFNLNVVKIYMSVIVIKACI